MNSEATPSANPIDNATAKLIACVVILVCLAVGLAGLILPIIPGLLFLGLAALIAARHSPALERLLRSNATISGYLDSTDGFLDLPLAKKVQLGLLLCVKMLIDTIAFVVTFVAKLVREVTSSSGQR
jgi:uncharacterized membrane protein YbaN (DUF454 family)